MDAHGNLQAAETKSAMIEDWPSGVERCSAVITLARLGGKVQTVEAALVESWRHTEKMSESVLRWQRFRDF